MATTKTEGGTDYPRSAYLVVENPSEPSTWHLRVKDDNGDPDHRLMGAAWAALHEGYRGNKYEGPNKEAALAKLTKLYKSEDLPLPGSSKSDGEPLEFPEDEVVGVFGSAVKALGDGKVAGYLVTFSDASSPDLCGDFFQSDTDFGTSTTANTLYNHGLDIKVGTKSIGEGSLKMDEAGIWIEAQLKLADAYEKAIYKLAEMGKLGWSSGTASHLVRRKRVGNANKILSWPLGLDASLTPTPAEPRNGVFAVKSLQTEELIPDPEEVDKIHDVTERNTNMEPTKPVAASTDEIKNAIDSALAQQKQLQEAEAKKRDQLAEITASITGFLADAMKSKPADNGGSETSGPYFNSKTQRGDDETKAFWYYVRTGDQSAVKTAVALNEADNEQGKVTVPTDFYARIVEKRNEVSIARAAGATVVQTSLNVLQVPTEGSGLDQFVNTAESNTSAGTSYDENDNEPLDVVNITVYKYTRLIKISEELVGDNKANLEGYLASALGRAAGLTENTAFLVGDGSGDPQGAVVGSTKGRDATAAGAVSAADLMALYYSLSQPYRENAVWVMAGATEGSIRALTTNLFTFAQTPQGSAGVSGLDTLIGSRARVYNSAAMAAIGASNKSVLFGNWEYYFIAERQGMTIRRLNERFADTGQIGILASYRVGGAVVQAEAFQHLLHPSA